MIRISTVFIFINCSFQVCRSWKCVGQDPELWQKVEISIGQSKTSTPNGLIQLILDKHSENLKSVVFKIDSAVESAEKVCQILSRVSIMQL